MVRATDTGPVSLSVLAANGIELRGQEKADKEEQEAATKIQACFRQGFLGPLASALSFNMEYFLNCTHRPLSSSFLGLPYRILNISHQKELLGGLWVVVITRMPW